MTPTNNRSVDECGRCVALTHVHKSAGTTLIRVLEDHGPLSKCGGIYYCNWRQYRATGCQRPTDFGALTSAPASAARAQVSPASSSTPSKQLQAQALSDALRWEADRQDFEHARLYYGGYTAAMAWLGSHVRTNCMFVALLREPMSRLVSISLYCKHGLHMGTQGIAAWLPVSQGGDVLCGGVQNASLATWARLVGNQFFRQLAIQPEVFSKMSRGRTIDPHATADGAEGEIRKLMGRHEKGKSRLGRQMLRKVENALRAGEMPNVVGIYEQLPRTLVMFDHVIPLNGGRMWIKEASRLAYTHSSGRWARQKQQVLRERESREAFAADLAADVRLYAAALGRFEKLCDEHGVTPAVAAAVTAAANTPANEARRTTAAGRRGGGHRRGGGAGRGGGHRRRRRGRSGGGSD